MMLIGTARLECNEIKEFGPIGECWLVLLLVLQVRTNICSELLLLLLAVELLLLVVDNLENCNNASGKLGGVAGVLAGVQIWLGENVEKLDKMNLNNELPHLMMMMSMVKMIATVNYWWILKKYTESSLFGLENQKLKEFQEHDALHTSNCQCAACNNCLAWSWAHPAATTNWLIIICSRNESIFDVRFSPMTVDSEKESNRYSIDLQQIILRSVSIILIVWKACIFFGNDNNFIFQNQQKSDWERLTRIKNQIIKIYDKLSQF